MVRDQDPQLADVAGSGDVYDVRAEPADFRQRAVIVPPERQVKPVVLVERKAEGAPPESDAPHGALGLSLVLRPAADNQEAESALLRERFKLAAGVRHPVDFVIGVREK